MEARGPPYNSNEGLTSQREKAEKDDHQAQDLTVRTAEPKKGKRPAKDLWDGFSSPFSLETPNSPNPLGLQKQATLPIKSGPPAPSPPPCRQCKDLHPQDTCPIRTCSHPPLDPSPITGVKLQHNSTLRIRHEPACLTLLWFHWTTALGSGPGETPYKPPFRRCLCLRT